MQKKIFFKKLKLIVFPCLCIFIFLSAPSLIQPESIKPDIKKIDIITLENDAYVSIYDFIRIFKIDNSYDIITKKGRLYHKTHVAVYQTGFSVALIDGSLKKSRYPVISVKGEILLPVPIFYEILKKFFPYSSITRNKNEYIVQGEEADLPESTDKGKSDRELADKIKYLDKKGTKDRIGFIIIDPGHGGKDPGAIGRGSIKEKHLTLKVADYTCDYLKRRLKNIRVVQTRTNDRFVELCKRTEKANRMLKNGINGLFVSIHINASISKKISGFETYFLSQNPTNEDARSTAALENNVVVLEKNMHKKSYDDVDYIEALMITTQIQKESSLLSHIIQKELDKKIWRFKSRGVKKADFFVLRGVLMPAALVEIGYISNNKELSYLRKNSYQKEVASGIGRGVINFINKYNMIIKK